MRIEEIIATSRDPVFSFEFFPPKTEEGERRLYEAAAELASLAPSFVSVTWGAGGSTREATIGIVARLGRELGLEAMPHLTCVGASVEELRVSLREMGEAGVENVLALRGDPPQGTDRFAPAAGGLAHASELARLISDEFPFTVVGACYPETHQEASDPQVDLENLQRKVGAGVRVLITQLFFDNADYFRFVDRARGAGIEVPIIPGIIPIADAPQLTRIAAMCGARVPEPLAERLEVLADRPEAVTELGIAFATQQCAELLAGGAPGIHFYTLNRAAATSAVLTALRIARPWESHPLAAAAEARRSATR